MTSTEWNNLCLYARQKSRLIQTNSEEVQREKLNRLLSSLPAKQNDSVQKKWVKNLSDRYLTDDQVALLSKGSKFTLAPKEIPILDIVFGVEEGLRQVPRDKKSFVDCARAKIMQILKRASPPLIILHHKSGRPYPN